MARVPVRATLWSIINAGGSDMFRTLIILAAVIALAASTAPASQASVGGKMHSDDISLGTITDKGLPALPKCWWSCSR
jgi:hypothetical protein